MKASPVNGSSLPRIAVVIDPRFPGGTSSAFAQELPVIDKLGHVEVHGISSAMFPDRPVNPVLKQALDRVGLQIMWDKPVISADLIILHNPSFLKFDVSLGSRLVCQNLIVVTHENFLNPLGALGFDVAGCLERIEEASICAAMYLAPVSQYNRKTVTDWLPTGSQWVVLPEDWFNVCEFDFKKPKDAPRDRRGRHSRPGFEKFPDMETMNRLFPRHAESNIILGGDTYTPDEIEPHWTVHKFGALAVDAFLQEIDFFVYYTHPTWRESFGRVIAEATAAGKLVITDVETAKIFGNGVIGTEPEKVDRIIAEHIATPAKYSKKVLAAQNRIKQFSAEAFAVQTADIITRMSYRGIRAAE